MKNFKRILKYEAVRAWAQKHWLAIIFAVLAVFFITFGVTAVKKDAEGNPYMNKEQMLESYQEWVDKEYKWAEEGGYELDDYSRKQVDIYEFFINTQTTEYDYITDLTINHIGRRYTDKLTGYETFTSCVYFFDAMTYGFCAFALVCALWAFSPERRNMKNLLAAPVKRKEIFAAKTGITFTAAMAPPVLTFITLLIICACSAQPQFLMYAGGCKVISGMHLFAQLGVRSLLTIACSYVITLLCSLYFKPLYSALVPLLGYFALLLVAMLLSKGWDGFFFHSFNGFGVSNFIPVLGMRSYIGGFDIHFIIIMLAHLAGICGLIFWSAKRFSKKDF